MRCSTRHPNHPVVTQLAGQSLALAAALSTALKFRGSFSVQAKGDGPVTMLLADCTDTGALRGYARCDADRLDALLQIDPSPSAAQLVGGGYLAFTVDQGPDQNRHQGIVTIEGGNLAEMALHYFRTSEQLRCFVHLACEPKPRMAGVPARWCWRRSPALAASIPIWIATHRRKAGAPRPYWPRR